MSPLHITPWVHAHHLPRRIQLVTAPHHTVGTRPPPTTENPACHRSTSHRGYMPTTYHGGFSLSPLHITLWVHAHHLPLRIQLVTAPHHTGGTRPPPTTENPACHRSTSHRGYMPTTYHGGFSLSPLHITLWVHAHHLPLRIQLVTAPHHTGGTRPPPTTENPACHRSTSHRGYMPTTYHGGFSLSPLHITLWVHAHHLPLRIQLVTAPHHTGGTRPPPTTENPACHRSTSHRGYMPTTYHGGFSLSPLHITLWVHAHHLPRRIQLVTAPHHTGGTRPPPTTENPACHRSTSHCGYTPTTYH